MAVTQLTFGARIGLVIVVEAALLSAIAVSTLLLYVLFNALRNKYNPSPRRGVQAWHFLRSPIDYYFLSLLVSDLIQAAGAILSIRWTHSGHLEPGAFCTAQAFLKQLGDVGVALATLVIGFHTFAVLCFRWRAPDGPLLPLTVIAVLWTFLLGATLIPHAILKNPSFYGPNAPWCWIDSHYRSMQYGLEYGIFWITALLNCLLYGVLFFCLRGNLIVDYDVPEGSTSSRRKLTVRWETIKPQDAWHRDNEQRKGQMVIARQMLWYPIAYVIMILPLSIVRPLQFQHGSNSVPSGASVLAGVIFGLSGLINALLYAFTRPAVFRSLRIYCADPRGHARRPNRTTVVRPAMTMPDVTVDESDAGECDATGEYENEGDGVSVMGGRSVPMSTNGRGGQVKSYEIRQGDRRDRVLTVSTVSRYPPSGHEWTPSEFKSGSWSPSELSAGLESLKADR